MTKFSSRTIQVIEAFARNMEIDQIYPAVDGSVTFEFEHAGRLCFTPFIDSSRVLVSLRSRRTNLQFEDLHRFLQLSGWESYHGFSINAGMSADGGLVLVANIEESLFTLQIVEQCLDRLIALQQSCFA
ncbi:type III secretion system chaperone SycN [Labrenzia sp. EL_142]|nr:type III secretion system chaperone SycN [Labrenzia sp. EL_142]